MMVNMMCMCNQKKKMARYFVLTVVRHAETPENKNNIFQGQKDTVLSEEGIRQAEIVGDRLKNEKFTHVYSSDLTRVKQTRDAILKHNQHSSSVQVVEDILLREKKYGEMEGLTDADFLRLAAEANTTPKAFVPKGAETTEQLRKRAVRFFLWLCGALLESKDPVGDALREEYPSEERQKFSMLSSNASGKDNHFTKDTVALNEESTESSSNCLPDYNQVANVLVVSHGGTISQMLHYFAKDLKSNFSVEFRCRMGLTILNTGVSKFHIYVDEVTKRPSFINFIFVNDGSHLNVGTGKSEESYAR